MQKFILLVPILLISVLTCSCSNSPSRKVIVQTAPAVLEDEEDWMQEDIITYKDGHLVNELSGEVDRLEKINRITFAFNKALDTVIMKPIATAYGKITPEICKKWITNFLHNLSNPLYVLYGVATADGDMVRRSLGRFIINTTFGTLGINDPASRFESFKSKKISGETILRAHGIKPGTYLVLPVLGSSSSRGALGLVMDLSLDPLSYQFKSKQALARHSMQLITYRYDALTLIEDIGKMSLDEYTATRNLYMQYTR